MGWVAAAVGLATFAFGNSGASKQAEVDRQQVTLGFEDNLEKIRRRAYTQKQTLGATKALSENAGVRHTAGSTPEQYIGSMADAFKKEIDWMRTYAHRARELGMKSADVRQSANTLNALSSGISTGMSVYGASG